MLPTTIKNEEKGAFLAGLPSHLLTQSMQYTAVRFGKSFSSLYFGLVCLVKGINSFCSLFIGEAACWWDFLRE